MKDYEALFIINPEKEKSLKEVTDTITNTVLKSNGKIGKEENWGKQRTAYPIKKNQEGIYYKLNFTVEPSKISVLNSAFRLNADILRVMITAR